MDEDDGKTWLRMRADLAALRMVVARLVAWRWSEAEVKDWLDHAVDEIEGNLAGQDEAAAEITASLHRLFPFLAHAAREVDQKGLRPPRS